MDSLDSITDPTDWADTAVTSLQPVEAALHCQICKEFFVNPVITSCAHTFCSICIRRGLSTDGKCPTCRSDDQPLRLRKNAVVEELVDVFKKARPDILRIGREVLAVRQGGSASSLKRKLDDVRIEDESIEDSEEGPRTRRKTRSQSRRRVKSQNSSVYEVSSDEESNSNSKKRATPTNDGKVECPICTRRMKEEEVFTHIDRDHNENPTAPPRAQSSMFGSQRNPRSPANGLEAAAEPQKLSALSYNLMNEAALRKKLGSLGIPSYGSKQAMEARHKEWLNIWNANCDSTRPHAKRDLLRDLDVWERTQGSQARGNSDSNGIMSKGFDRSAWSSSNGNDFKDLIAKARAKKASAPLDQNAEKSPPVLPSSDGAQNNTTNDLGESTSVFSNSGATQTGTIKPLGGSLSPALRPFPDTFDGGP